MGPLLVAAALDWALAAGEAATDGLLGAAAEAAAEALAEAATELAGALAEVAGFAADDAAADGDADTLADPPQASNSAPPRSNRPAAVDVRIKVRRVTSLSISAKMVPPQ